MYLDYLLRNHATTAIYTLSLHDALPIYVVDEQFFAHRSDLTDGCRRDQAARGNQEIAPDQLAVRARQVLEAQAAELHEEERRSEEHTSELQSQSNLVCRLLLEKKKEEED